MRCLTVILTVLLLITATYSLCAPISKSCKHGKLQKKQTYNNYAVKIFRADPESLENIDYDVCIEILKGKAPVYSATGNNMFYLDGIYKNKDKNFDLPMGIDITGKGLHALVITEHTGGSHCCCFFHIFEIGKKFRFIQTIDATHTESPFFENLDNDPDLELKIYDWTFAYWKASFAQSPAPEVILKFNGTQYEIATNIMRRPPSETKELNALSEEIRSLPRWDNEHDPIPERLWEEMLNLIYSGNMDQAWLLFDSAWHEKVKGKKQFLEDFKNQLKSSPYWTEIEKENLKKNKNSEIWL